MNINYFTLWLVRGGTNGTNHNAGRGGTNGFQIFYERGGGTNRENRNGGRSLPTDSNYFIKWGTNGGNGPQAHSDGPKAH